MGVSFGPFGRGSIISVTLTYCIWQQSEFSFSSNFLVVCVRVEDLLALDIIVVIFLQLRAYERFFYRLKRKRENFDGV